MTAVLERSEWSAARPRRTLPPGKDPVPILQEAVWAPGPVWTGGKSLPHRDSIPDRPARSSVPIPTELPGCNGDILLIFIGLLCDWDGLVGVATCNGLEAPVIGMVQLV